MALRPAHDVYHRLRWDPAIDETTAEVVVLDRKRGPVAMPFAAFDPHGEIPFSRVVGFRLDGVVVWDREARIDRVFGTGSTPGESLAGALDPVPSDRTVRVLTLNVLFDRYDQDVVRTAERTPKLLALLEQVDADLVALQEVEPWLVTRLLAEPFVQARYQASDPGDGATVIPYGQLLLSKAPLLSSQVVPLGGDKRHLVTSVGLTTGRTRVVVVHLSSDRHADAPERRAQQLAVLRPHLGPGPALVLGDVNQDEPVDLPLDDAWTLRHPDDPGYTWDPARNVLARFISRNGARRRLDRVLVRGFAVASIDLVGIDASELPLSDHYGLLATLRPHVTPPRDRAWVLPVSPDVARRIEPLRRRFDPGRFRWPPHLTLTRDPVRASGTEVDAELGGVLLLTTTAGLPGPPRRVGAVPDEPGEARVRALRTALGASSQGRPHVTVGQTDAPALARALQARLPLPLPLTRVERWERADDGQMRLVEAIGLPRSPLGFEAVLDLHGLSEPPDEDPTSLLAAVRAAAGGPVSVVGSARLSAQLPEGDLDLVVRHADATAVHARVRKAFAGLTTAAGTPVTRFVTPLGTPPLPRAVDVTVVPPQIADGPDPEADWTSLETAITHVPRESFARVLRAVKGWAVARQVHDPAWGFLPGLAQAWAVADAHTDDSEAHWFERALERLRTAATTDDARYRRVAIDAVTSTLVEEIDRARLLIWDDAWEEVFASAFPEPGPGMHLDLRGPDPDALTGWLRGRIGFVLTSLANGSDAVRLRPYPRPTPRRSQTLRFTIRWAHVDDAIVSSVLADLHDRFRRSTDRPDGGELDTVRLPGP